MADEHGMTPEQAVRLCAEREERAEASCERAEAAATETQVRAFYARSGDEHAALAMALRRALDIVLAAQQGGAT